MFANELAQWFPNLFLKRTPTALPDELKYSSINTSSYVTNVLQQLQKLDIPTIPSIHYFNLSISTVAQYIVSALTSQCAHVQQLYCRTRNVKAN